MIRKLTLGVVVGVLLLIVAMPTAAQDYESYIVQPGDTLAKIALRFCTNWPEIYNINRQAIGDNPNVLLAGTVLTVPNRCGATAPPPTTDGVYDRGIRAHATGGITNSNIYAVAWGDTLFSIGQRFGVTVDQLRAANGLTDESILFAGARIVIPGLNGVFVQQLTLVPGVDAPVVGSALPSTERAFAIGECRVEVISDITAHSTPDGPVLTTIPAGEYAAARISVVDRRDWFQIEYIDTLIWIADTVERMDLGRVGNCSP